MTPEAKVKEKVKKILKEVGSYYFMPATGGYGKSGVPDIVACHKGKFYGIECKAGNNKPTALQYKALRDIEIAGGVALWVNEETVNSVKQILSDST
jgi:Holliday junction resolvase